MPNVDDEHLIRRLLQCQGSYDWETIAEILADDAVFEMPFIQEKFVGKTQIIERWRPSLERMEGVKFYEIEISPMAEPGHYMAKFRNICSVRATGMVYDQIYLGLFHINSGKIVYFAEYFDTLRLALTLRRVQPLEASPNAPE
jgi:ketosteroid isomerase-like protein